MLESINTVELPVADLARAIAWYESILGLRVQWRGDRSAVVGAGDGGTRLYLVQTDDPARLRFTNTADGTLHSVVDFYTRDLAATHAQLRRRGVEIDDLREGALGFGLSDLDSNRLGVTCVRHADA